MNLFFPHFEVTHSPRSFLQIAVLLVDPKHGHSIFRFGKVTTLWLRTKRSLKGLKVLPESRVHIILVVPSPGRVVGILRASTTLGRTNVVGLWRRESRRLEILPMLLMLRRLRSLFWLDQ